MISRITVKICGLVAAAFVILGSHSCVKVDNSLGSNLIPLSQLYDVYSAEFPLTDINMKMLDSLTGYSNTRITIGAVRDAEFGLTTRSCALSLVPVVDSVDFGRNPEFKYFRFTAQNEQDSRFWGTFGMMPVFEPSNQQEAYEMTRAAFDYSEKRTIPVIMRLTTRMAHSRAVVTPTGDIRPQNELHYPAISPSFWTATAAGPKSAACPGPWATKRAAKP